MGRLSLPALLCTVALLLPLVLPSAAADRRLERALGEAAYGESGLAIVEKSYRAAVKSGLGRREMLALAKLCAEGGFDASETARALTIAAQLGLAGLPSGGFESKIKEGVAKRVAPAQILAAAEEWALAVNRAKKLLNNLILQGYDIAGDEEELLSSVAQAFETGKDEQDIRGVLLPALEDGDNVRKIRRRLLR